MTSSAFEPHLQKWWANRPDDQRKALAEAAEADRMDDSTVKLLVDTRCPVGPVGTSWESQPNYSWHWASTVRDFILAQQ